MLALGGLLNKQVRKLSLGERMKCELAAALLHGPQVLFLDEPTIGLDVSMQAKMREFIRDYNERFGAAVLLTSHYMDDVVALCPRVVVIDHGHLIYDGDLQALVRRVRPDKRVSIRLSAPIERAQLDKLGVVVSADAAQAVNSVVSGPRVPSAIDISAAPMFGIRAVTQNGLRRSGPASNSLRCAISSVLRPPMPVPIEQPIRSASARMSMPASSTAIVAAATANCAKRSVFRTERCSM